MFLLSKFLRCNSWGTYSSGKIHRSFLVLVLSAQERYYPEDRDYQEKLGVGGNVGRIQPKQNFCFSKTRALLEERNPHLSLLLTMLHMSVLLALMCAGKLENFVFQDIYPSRRCVGKFSLLYDLFSSSTYMSDQFG